MTGGGGAEIRKLGGRGGFWGLVIASSAETSSTQLSEIMRLVGVVAIIEVDVLVEEKSAVM